MRSVFATLVFIKGAEELNFITNGNTSVCTFQAFSYSPPSFETSVKLNNHL